MLEYTDIERHKVSQEEYFQMEGISNSDMKLFKQHPRKYKYKENVDSPAFAFGSAFDTYLLENDKFDERVDIAPDNLKLPSTDLQLNLAKQLSRNSNNLSLAFEAAGYKRVDMKTAKELMPYADYLRLVDGKIVIDRESFYRILEMAHNVQKHSVARAVLEESEKQLVYTAIHGPTGLKVKGMIDMAVVAGGSSATAVLVVDLKTTSFPLNQMQETIDKYGYEYQLAHYSALAGGIVSSGIMAVETRGFNEVGMFRINPDTIRQRQKEISDTLKEMFLSKQRYDFEERATYGAWVEL
jgi:hypothetical protein